MTKSTPEIRRRWKDRIVGAAVVTGLALTFQAAKSLPGFSARLQNVSASAAPATGPDSEVQVWVNTGSGIYHFPGTRYYGTTRRGEYMSVSAAKAKGFRAARNRQ